MSTIETPSIGTVEIDEDVPFETPDDMEAHLYVAGNPKTLCGIPRNSDPHNCMHMRYGDYIARARKGDKACPACGAVLCEECERLLNKEPRLR